MLNFWNRLYLPDQGLVQAFLEAAYRGDLEEVTALLNRTPKLVHLSHEYYGYTALHRAARRGQRGVIELLLSRGADVNAKANVTDRKSLHDKYRGTASVDLDGVTPLYMAHGGLEIMELLLANGADVNANGKNGDSPLHGAIKRTGTKIESFSRAELLLTAGADVNAKDFQGKSALHLAVFYDLPAIAELLITRNANVNGRDKSGDTPLHQAHVHPKLTELLLASGADVNARNSYGATPLHDANVVVAELLLASGADVNAKDSSGLTPLVRADRDYRNADSHSEGLAALVKLLERHGGLRWS